MVLVGLHAIVSSDVSFVNFLLRLHETEISNFRLLAISELLKIGSSVLILDN
jgi:hypothetical protein